MDKKEIVRTLEQMADLMEIRGDNPFKCIAHRNAARAVGGLEESLEYLVAAEKLVDVKGIGKGLAGKIAEMVETGRLEEYETLRAEIPEGVVEMLSIGGFGPKKAKAVWEELGIESVGELEYACRENHLLDLKGFGKKTQEKILRAIDYYKRQVGHYLCDAAWRTGMHLLEHIQRHKDTARAEIAGSLRRCKEIVGDIDLLASSDAPEALMEHFVGAPGIEEVIARGTTKTSVRMIEGIQVDLRVVSDEQFPFALAYFTGSKEHNTALRRRARRQGLKLNEYGLSPQGSDQSEPCGDETAIYQRLGLPFIEPELRENMGEIDAAEEGTLPELVKQSDIRGLVHVHSNWSDGRLSIEQMAQAAAGRGFEYVVICDHSRSAAYARGLAPERVLEQHREIDRLNQSLSGIRVFKGTEVDILADGSVDFEDDLLAQFDLVIASIHSRFNLPGIQQTGRLLKAIRHPFVHMIGHPTGRLLLSREGYEVDLAAVIDAAAEHRKMIELNANPFRLDLDWRYCMRARRKGVMISINPDAHDEAGIDDIRYGVGIARKGWYEAKMVANALPLKEFEKLIRK